MSDDGEYGTLAWMQKYEPEACEVAFPAGFKAGYAQCKEDMLSMLREWHENGSVPRYAGIGTLERVIEALESDMFTGHATKENDE